MFHPTADEEIVGNAHINHGPCNLNSAALAVPASEWDGRHLKHLRVVLLDDLDLSRLFLSSMYLLKAIRVSQVEIPLGISLIPLLVYMDLASTS